MILKVNATRMELSRLKKEYAIAVSGHRLLKDKRDEMMRQFLQMTKDASVLRKELETQLSKAYIHFAFASAAMGTNEFKTALLGSQNCINLTVEKKSIMNVSLPLYNVQFHEYVQTYSTPFTVSDLSKGIEILIRCSEGMVRLAELEGGIKKLSSELEKTRRHVNSLEHVTIPNYKETIHFIRMKIEENTRSNTARLIKVKDMMVSDKQ